MSSQRFLFSCVPALLLLATLLVELHADGGTYQLVVSAGQQDRQNVPVKVVFSVPESLAKATSVELTDAAGKRLAGQLTTPSLLAKSAAAPLARELNFVLPSLKAGQSVSLTAKVSAQTPSGQDAFAWTDTAGKHAELAFAGRPVLRYMYEALDESRREETYKIYHHVFDPQGKRLVTKGPGGQFTHHRGVFYGFNKVTYGGGKKTDIWHCTNGAHQAHAGFLVSDAGAVLGRQRLAVEWRGNDKQTFAQEERELTVFNVPGGHLIEFASRLHSKSGQIKLDGDPQHAGFHFRAAQEVAADTKGQTYYLRPDGQDKPGATRNWPGQKEHVNLPWNVMSFVVGGQRYSCCYLDRPQNPKEARFSERDYGRFGSYFEYELDESKPLEVNYRVWLQAGETTSEAVRALAADFVEPVSIEMK